MSIGSFFTKKIGPLPVWGYGAIAAGGTFILLKGSGSAGKGKKAGSGPASNAPGGSSTGSFTSNTTETLSDDQTFGGGALGFLGLPFFGGRNIFVHLHQHPGGGYFSGGRRYSDHAFRPFGFGRDGSNRGGFPGTDHRHGFAGGRNYHGPQRGGHPRGFEQGHYNPFAGIGSRLATSFHPGSPSARRNPGYARHLNADARPSNR
jgi:hypothetical protein